MMLTGRRQTPAADYPELGAVAARSLTPPTHPLPGHIRIVPWSAASRGNEAAYLGPQYASIVLGGGNAPPYTALPDGIEAGHDVRRHAFRQSVDEVFLNGYRSAMTDAFVSSYDAAQKLMNPSRSMSDTARVILVVNVCWLDACCKTTYRSCK